MGWFGTWHTIREGYAGLLYRDGVFLRVVPPGRTRLTDREQLDLVVTARQTLIVAGQELLCTDGFQPRLTAAIFYVVADPHRAQTYQAGGYQPVLLLEAQLALRALAAPRRAEELVSLPRETLDAELLAAMRPPCAVAGLEVESVRLRDVVLPADLRRLITGVEKARREGQVALERAHAEQASLRALANAARMLRNNPELQNLRLLQTIGSGTAPVTLVLGTPAGMVPLAEPAPDQK